MRRNPTEIQEEESTTDSFLVNPASRQRYNNSFRLTEILIMLPVKSIAIVLFLLSKHVAALPYAAPILTPISNWGYNPTDLELLAYFPTPMPSRPAVILAVGVPNTHQKET
jgi:hypothetical protein